MLHCGIDENACLGVIRDALGIRLPRTAIKRAVTFSRFLSWMKAHNEEYAFLSREHVIRLLTPASGSVIAPSTGTSLTECLRFAHCVLDFGIPPDVLEDRQILGKVQRLRVSGEYRPARDLLLCEVAVLERSMTVHNDPTDRYILGACLFALFSRSRWSDLQHLHNIWVERHQAEDGTVYGFIEARTKFHKTGTSMERKLRYLPLVCPLLGVTGLDWTKHWFDAMREVGFNYYLQP